MNHGIKLTKNYYVFVIIQSEWRRIVYCDFIRNQIIEII